MDINELTIGQLKEINTLLGNQAGKRHNFEVGKNYFIRSVTHHYLGKVVDICDLCIVMECCAWVADNGRFSEAMKGHWMDAAEHEPYPPKTKVQLFYGAMLEAVDWAHDLITDVK